MEIDVIILSYAKNDDIIKMNNDCINSINNSTKNYSFNIILVETDNNRTHKYSQKNVQVVQPGVEFNYNKFLNIGLKYCKNEWILLSNNDVIYDSNFIDYMLEEYNKDNQLLSMSPMDNTWFRHKEFSHNVNVYYGYRTSFEITGWSILLNKMVVDKIGGSFDENFKFWYQDNDYSNNLIKYKIKHGLVTKSNVTHLLSKSHGLIENNKKFEMTDGQSVIYNKKWR